MSGADVPLDENAGSPLIERNSDYAINILYVLGFMCSGDGGKEAERLLGLLGLPNSTTMEKRSFGTMSRQIGQPILDLADATLLENLEIAVKEYHETTYDNNEESERLFALWKSAVANPNAEMLPRQHYPKLNLSADMGWQRRSSGNAYNSNSGHAVLVEQTTRHPVIRSIKSKLCAVCQGQKRSKKITEHQCFINHDGSASSMEPLAVLEMVVRLFDDFKVETAHVIADDDSSMKAKLKYSNADFMVMNNLDKPPTIINSNGNEVVRPDKGRLPRYMLEPIFWHDPNHRKKTLKGELYGQLKKRKASREGLTRCDILRITTNFAYMVRTLHHKSSDAEFVEAGKAVVEHHFDNHECCGKWCRRKDMTNEEKAECPKVYRSKEKDATLYKHLTATMARFISLSALREVGHGMDTQVNESLNNTFSWCAPKNKTYCGTVSLSLRIAIATSIHTIGTERFFNRLFETLGIDVSPLVTKHLKQQQSIRASRLKRSRKKEVKLVRNLKLHERLRKHTEDVKKENCKRDGIAYQPGMGINGGCTEEELNQSAAAKHPTKAPVVCPHCGKKGHKTTRSNKCDKHVAKDKQQQQQQETPSTAPAANVEALQAKIDGDEADLMDQIPLDCSDDEFFDSLESETKSMASSSS